ncbi:MAG: HmuY family protein [Capnocytophaga sp.]|nr:HmuY family protein [Capnocytophaga sp.]
MKKKFLMLAIATGLILNCTKNDEVEKQPDNNGTPPTPKGLVEAGKDYSVFPNVGGPNQPNQVYVDLSSGKTTVVKRDVWDLAFYCGDDFRVIINPAIAMTVKATEITDITKFLAPDDKILFTDDPKLPSQKQISKHLIDDPRGILEADPNIKGTGTAIAQIAANDKENKVYLLNMGNEISTTTPEVGGVNLQGAHRGYQKIRIIRNGNGYQIQYAKNDVLESSQIKTISIAKNSEYNFVFLNLSSGKLVDVQPKKKDWDLCFTPSTSWFSTDKVKIESLFNSASYFPDMIVTNLLGGTKATIYQAKDKKEETRDKDYTNYKKENALKIDFSKEKYTNQMTIGRNWRDNQGGAVLRKELYFLIKDGDGNFFKLKMTAFRNDKNERGNPAFVYQLLK